MTPGWYRAGKSETVTGKVLYNRKGKPKRKVGSEFLINTLSRFELDNTLNNTDIHQDIWDSLAEFRSMFTEARNDLIARNAILERKTLILLEKMFPERPWSEDKMSKTDITEMIA